jgi:hypothetical protein
MLPCSIGTCDVFVFVLALHIFLLYLVLAGTGLFLCFFFYLCTWMIMMGGFLCFFFLFLFRWDAWRLLDWEWEGWGRCIFAGGDGKMGGIR